MVRDYEITFGLRTTMQEHEVVEYFKDMLFERPKEFLAGSSVVVEDDSAFYAHKIQTRILGNEKVEPKE